MRNLCNKKSFITLCLSIILLFSNSIFVYGNSVGIEDEVSGYLLGDFKNGEILEEYNIDKPIEIASITKLMTYLVVMDEIEKGTTSMDDNVRIDKEVEEVKGSSLNLKEGEMFTVEELIEGLLVVSANDGAVALAKHIAGSEREFVNKMNTKAKELELKNTLYFNSTGLPEEKVKNLMSPEDIFTLAKHIIKEYPEVLKVSSIPYIENEEREFKQENTNHLLNNLKGVDGLKTGFTEGAGYCLVSTMEINDCRLIGIVMGTEDEEKRNELSKTLLQYGLNNYSKEIIASTEKVIATKKIPNSKIGEIEIFPIRDVNVLKKEDENIKIDVIPEEKLKAPLKKGEVVGKLAVLKDDVIIDEVDLIVKEDYKKAFFLTTIFRYIKGIFVD
ncbi:MAG TPA: D-alanyl-D-alanine carboxypeptidase family protein [Tissierellales bacterium]|nr:D-alanyl-D-alanine carboxypeptidase family protein [Tissierellales bacterium]